MDSSSSVGAGESTDNNEDLLGNNRIEVHSSGSTTTRSAQSQVLGNLDLLQSIFSFFHCDVEAVSRIPVPDSQHLLWASLTCRTFFEPSMNILWRTMDSWEPLLQVIPVLTREEIFRTMDGIVREEDLQRLHLYGRRTRRLDLPRLKRSFVSPYIYTFISQLSHSHLFPALRQLIIQDIDGISEQNLPGLFLTPSPSLSELSISGIFPATVNTMAALFQSVNMKSPTLRSLTLAGVFFISGTNPLSLVNQFEKLETLRIDTSFTNFPGNTLDHFSKLMCLKSLCIIFVDRSSFSSPSPTISSFEALDSLELSAKASDVLAVLQHIDVPHMKRIRVHFTSLGPGASQEILGKCIQSISLLTKATQTLKTVHITSANASTRIPLEELAQLKAHTKVMHINMTLDMISHQKIRGLFETSSQTWVSIETLTLRAGMKAWSYALSIYRLLRLLDFFPNLKYLAMSVVIRTGPETSDFMQKAVQKQVPCHNLQELTLLPCEDSSQVLPQTATTMIEYAFDLSRYIVHFCPHLKTLDLSRITEVPSDWREAVKAMVRGLQEERNRGHVCLARG